MGFYSEAIRARLDGRAIGFEPMVMFDFAPGPARFWLGFGDLEAGGETWVGTDGGSGSLISIGGLGWSSGDTASQMTFTLSGVPTGDLDTMALAARLAIADQAEYVGRTVTVYVQCFDVTGDQPTHPLDAPRAVAVGLMDKVTISRSGPSTRSITLTAESENWDRRLPRYGLMTNADQQARWPGDTALQWVAGLRWKSLRQPW